MNKSKKIALIVDEKKWAFDRIAQAIVSHASTPELKYEIFYANEFSSIILLLEKVSHFDLVHFFLRTYLVDNMKHIVKWKKSSEFFSNMLITTGVHEQHLINGEMETDISLNFLHDYYYVINKRLFSIYSSLPCIVPPLSIIYDGINIKEFEAPKRVFEKRPTIGWVGNSLHAKFWSIKYPQVPEYKDSKGFFSLLKPALKNLKYKGHQFNFLFLDSAQTKIEPAEMKDFYKKIDILVCSSKTDGTPLPILEAMASGALIVSTEVGVVNEILGPQQKKYMIKGIPTIKKLTSAIEQLLTDKELWDTLSKENKKQVQAKDWASLAFAYNVFFETCLHKGKRTGIIAPSFFKILKKTSEFPLVRKIYESMMYSFKQLPFIKKLYILLIKNYR